MPVTPTYPGVYIEEVPSGIRTITGVATAITAFIGRAVRGPTDQPTRIQNFGDYVRTFGGLSLDSPLSYAVQQFLSNGGTDAIIVRSFKATSAADDGVGRLALGADTSARGTLTLGTQPANSETMTIGATTYTFLDVLDNTSANNIQIGDSLAATKVNIIAAINDSGDEGEDYSTGTVANADAAAATTWSGDDLVLVARTAGVAGNSIVTTETFGDAGNVFDAPTLGTTTQGRDQADGVEGAVSAQGILTCDAPGPADGSTMTIGATTYTFQSTLDNTTPNNIFLAATIGAIRTNIIAAINGTGTAGTDYSTGTVANTDVNAAAGAPAAEIDIEAIQAGTAANSIALAPASGDLRFDGTALGQERAGVDIPAFTLVAASPGAWSQNLRVTVDHHVKDPADEDAFNLTVEELDPSLPAGAPARQTETFLNLSVAVDSPLRVDTVLANRSQLVRVGTTGTTLPAAVDAVRVTDGNDGAVLDDNAISAPGLEANKRGIWALEDADLFNILCIPPLAFGTDIGASTRDAALRYCKHRRAFYVVDPPSTWTTVDQAVKGVDTLNMRDENAAVYFPRVRLGDPLRDNQLAEYAPCGIVAGLYARTDARRGVWKAPAGTEATLSGVRELTLKMTDGQNGLLNPLGVNCLRTFRVIGPVAWGARTLEGADQLASEWKYVPVRRTALFIEETLYRALQWVVFEPNDEPLWAQIRLNVGSFMQTLFRQGAFQGSSPKAAFLVKCDAETTTQADIDRGIVNILVGFAPLKPAEFVFVKIQQLAGQLQA